MKISKVKEILLPVELLRELLRYEYETGLFYWIKKPHPKANRIKIGQVAGYLNSRGYTVIEINNQAYKAHRLAWAYVHGDYPPGEQPFIDHINGKPADNRIENLKVSSHAENMRNMKVYSRNTSGITGVARHGKFNNSKKNPKINYYCVASWYNKDGKECRKSFSINTYGEEQAKQLAINYRVEQIRLLEENHGIVYSDRHGI